MCSRCLATVRGLTSSLWAMAVLVRPSATSRRIWISRSVRSASQRPAVVASACPGLLASASPEQGSAQREPEHAVQGAIVVGEVVTPPVHGHAGNLLLGAGQADGYLVFDRCGAKELCIQAEAVESLPGEEVADP